MLSYIQRYFHQTLAIQLSSVTNLIKPRDYLVCSLYHLLSQLLLDLGFICCSPLTKVSGFICSIMLSYRTFPRLLTLFPKYIQEIPCFQNIQLYINRTHVHDICNREQRPADFPQENEPDDNVLLVFEGIGRLHTSRACLGNIS